MPGKAVVDYQKVVRDTVKHIGYDDSSKGKRCSIAKMLEQSRDVGVNLRQDCKTMQASEWSIDPNAVFLLVRIRL